MATVLDQLYDVAVLLMDLEQMDDDDLRAAFAEGFREHPEAVQG
jgi:aminoglycoside phosphotransferase family enzyme